MGRDTSTDAAVEKAASQGVAGASQMANYRQNGSRRGNTAPTSDERAVWLGILQDWILSAQDAGLVIEIYDMRPDEDAVGVVIRNVCYHANCGNLSPGRICGKCGKDVVISVTT